MSDFNRADRVGEQVKRILALIISREIRDENLQFVSITAVKLSTDLSVARIYVTSFDTINNRNDMLKILNEAAGFLRSRLSKQLTTHRTPSLYFVYDESIEYANKMEALIDDIGLDDLKK